MMFKCKKTALTGVVLSSLAVLASCGGAQDPLVVIPIPTPSIPDGSEPSPNYTDLTPEQMEATGDCIPAVPVSGQSILVKTEGSDPLAPDANTSGGGLFPNGVADVTYTFSEGEFEIASSDRAAYIPDLGGAYDPITGLVNTNYSAILADPLTDSQVVLNPSDWAQQLARKLNDAEVGATASIELKLKARGALPNLLAPLVATIPEDEIDPKKEALLATFTVTATRDPNGTKMVASTSIPVCNFSFKIDRPYQVKDPAIFTPGNHGPYVLGSVTDSAPWNLTVASELAAANALGVAGAGLESYVAADPLLAKLFLEPYIPAFAGTFSTSNLVPFVPVELSWVHTYGVSAPTNPIYENSVGQQAKLLEVPAPATQKFTFVSSSS